MKRSFIVGVWVWRHMQIIHADIFTFVVLSDCIKIYNKWQTENTDNRTTTRHDTTNQSQIGPDPMIHSHATICQACSITYIEHRLGHSVHKHTYSRWNSAKWFSALLSFQWKTGPRKWFSQVSTKSILLRWRIIIDSERVCVFFFKLLLFIVNIHIGKI